MNLIATTEPPVIGIENPAGKSDIVLICEHGGNAFPASLNRLGLSEQDVTRHFAWDIGALDVAKGLSNIIDATLIHQIYSRLICDCNRKPTVSSFIPEFGEELIVPGNRNVSEAEQRARIKEIWHPFHDYIAALLTKRARDGRTSIVISMHSFTPVFREQRRVVEIGILCDRDRRLSDKLYRHLQPILGAGVALNVPYFMSRETDFTIPVHGEERGLLCTEIEIRNDLIADFSGAEKWALLLAEAISTSLYALKQG